MEKENKHGNIGDFPREDHQEKPEPVSGFYDEKVVPKKISQMPGVGKKGGEGKIFKQYVEMMKKKKEEKEEKEEKKKKKKSD